MIPTDEQVEDAEIKAGEYIAHRYDNATEEMYKRFTDQDKVKVVK